MKGLIFSGIIFFCGLSLAHCSGSRPAHLGVHDSRLAACPDSPNCVSSQSTDTAHSIEPLRYADSPAEARRRLLAVFESLQRTTVVVSTDEYLHVECTSAVFRFVDDVEFFFNDESRVIHVRSASRLGYWDLGVNRKRVETVRARFAASDDRDP